MYLRQSSNATSTTVIRRGSTKDSSDSSVEATESHLRTLKLEDYGKIALKADIQKNRESRQSFLNEDKENEIDSTTMESSTITMNLEREKPTENNYVALTPPVEENSPQNNFYIPSSNYFPYPSSGNSFGQHVSISYSPNDKPYQPPKRYYDFYPSQSYYRHQNYIPYYCINSIYHKFTPIVHDTLQNYHHK